MRARGMRRLPPGGGLDAQWARQDSNLGPTDYEKPQVAKGEATGIGTIGVSVSPPPSS
jgi:hypothetical protein